MDNSVLARNIPIWELGLNLSQDAADVASLAQMGEEALRWLANKENYGEEVAHFAGRAQAVFRLLQEKGVAMSKRMDELAELDL